MSIFGLPCGRPRSPRSGQFEKERMKKFSFAAALLALCPFSNASPELQGEFLCNGCHGYLTIKPNKANTYKVWLGVGGGSCGGMVFAKDDFARPMGNKFSLTWKSKKKICKTEIVIDGNMASISDSCTKAEEEDGSTCAVLGDYIKRDSAK
jgi:hypothetical protein